MNQNIDWLAVFSVNDSLDLPYTEVTIKPLQCLLNIQIQEQAFELTQSKFPKWPYRLNKRADKFFVKMYNTYIAKKNPFECQEQIVPHENGYTVYIDINVKDDNDCLKQSAINQKILNMFMDFRQHGQMYFKKVAGIGMSTIDNVEDED